MDTNLPSATGDCPARATALLLLAVLIPGCAAPSFQLMPRYGTSAISGSSAVVAEGVDLQANDVEDSLGLDEDSSVPGVRFDADFGLPTLTLAAQWSDFSGEGTLETEISEGGVTIPAGADVATDLDFDVYSLLYTFDVIPSDQFELGLGLGVHLIDLFARVESREPGIDDEVTVDEAVPFPVVALRGGLAFDPFELSAVFSGLTVKVDGDEATFYDLDVSARWWFAGGERFSGALAVGWRQTILEAEYDDEGDAADLDLEFAGPYVGLVLGF